LGIRNQFPVNDSLSIRSKIHNGNPNLPTLFWAKKKTEIPAEIKKIAHEVSNEHIINLKLLNITGALKMPNISKQITEVYIDQWLYFDAPSTEIGQLKIQFGDSNQEIELKKIDKVLTADIFVDEIVPIWNSMIIQLHINKEVVPIKNFGLMEEIFQYLLKNRNETDGKIEREFRSKISDTRSILDTQDRFEADGFVPQVDGIDCAGMVLRSAVKRSK